MNRDVCLPPEPQPIHLLAYSQPKQRDRALDQIPGMAAHHVVEAAGSRSTFS
jgi:hypothetical protein